MSVIKSDNQIDNIALPPQNYSVIKSDNQIDNIALSLQKKLKLYNERPTFFINSQCIRACGMIFYRINKLNEIELLVIKNDKSIYEDIGGKTDKLDNKFVDTLFREVEEETNNVINKSIVKEEYGIIDKCINENNYSKLNYIYNNSSKYLIVLCKANKAITALTSNDFGKYELLNEKIVKTREIEWVSLKSFLKNPIHRRINIKGLESKFKKIQKTLFI